MLNNHKFMAKNKSAEAPKMSPEDEDFEAELSQMTEQIGGEKKALEEMFDETLTEATQELGLEGQQAEKYKETMQAYKETIIDKAIEAKKPGAALIAELHGRSVTGEKIPESKLRSYEHVVDSSVDEIAEELKLGDLESGYWKEAMLERKNILARQAAGEADATAKLLEMMRNNDYVDQAKAYGNLIEHYQSASPEEQAKILANSEKFVTEGKAEADAIAVHKAFLEDVREGRASKVKGEEVKPRQLPEVGETVSAKKEPEKQSGGIMGFLKGLFGRK